MNLRFVIVINSILSVSIFIFSTWTREVEFNHTKIHFSGKITFANAQNKNFWMDETIEKAWEKNYGKACKKRKFELKKELFTEVVNQTGKMFDPNVLTFVWARRFAGYKRADMFLHDLERFHKLLTKEKYPVQIIWKGKPYPMDYYAIDIFNYLVNFSKMYPILAVLVSYEIDLSKKLKCGSDVWLNTARVTREASGTIGMVAAMNGYVNVSINDGWIPEFGQNGKNCFVLPEVDHNLPYWKQDRMDRENLYDILEIEVIPAFYDKSENGRMWSLKVWMMLFLNSPVQEWAISITRNFLSRPSLKLYLLGRFSLKSFENGAVYGT